MFTKIVKSCLALGILISIILLLVQYPLIVGALIIITVLSVIFTDIPYYIILFFFNPRPYVQAITHPFKHKTIWRTSKGAIIPESIKKHEARHLYQVEKYGAVPFTLLILIQLVWYGYKDSPLEVDAREAETK